MTGQTHGGQAGCPRWARVLLGLSLALNLLVLGLAVGAILRFGGPDGMRPPPRSMATAMIRELPPEQRHALWDTTRGTHDDHRARRRSGAEAVSGALRAVPFDAGALSAVLDEYDRRRAAFETTVEQAWLAQVERMNDAERAAYADRLERAMHRDRSWRRR